MAIRYVRAAIPGVAAGAKSGAIAVPSFDDNINRKLIGYLSTNQVKLEHVILDVAGRVFADLDGGLNAQQRDFIDLDQDFPAGVQFSFNFANDSAGALAGNVDCIVLKYQTQQGIGGIPGVSSA
jgi:hypothetical protein